MAISQSKRSFAATRLRDVACALLDASTLCAIATVSPNGRAYVSTAYFAWSDDFDLVWLSEPRAAHSRNLKANSAVAVAIYDSRQQWGKPDRGIQLFGAAREVAGAAARAAAWTYAGRFGDYAEAEFSAYRFYRFRPRRLKLFDEPTLGRGVFVTARVTRGELAWARTEIYDSAA